MQQAQLPRRRAQSMTIVMPATFAEQLRLDLPKLEIRLKLPPWLEMLFVEDRKDRAALTDTETRSKISLSQS